MAHLSKNGTFIVTFALAYDPIKDMKRLSNDNYNQDNDSIKIMTQSSHINNHILF